MIVTIPTGDDIDEGQVISLCHDTADPIGAPTRCGQYCGCPIPLPLSGVRAVPDRRERGDLEEGGRRTFPRCSGWTVRPTCAIALVRRPGAGASTEPISLSGSLNSAQRCDRERPSWEYARVGGFPSTGGRNRARPGLRRADAGSGALRGSGDEGRCCGHVLVVAGTALDQ